MASGIRRLDPAVIIPLTLGVVFTVLCCSKLINWLFARRYALMYHLILGTVVGSTVAIIPSGVSGWGSVVCILLCGLGAAASYAFALLDERRSQV
jgi:putative membrane protein